MSRTLFQSGVCVGGRNSFRLFVKRGLPDLRQRIIFVLSSRKRSEKLPHGFCPSEAAALGFELMPRHTLLNFDTKAQRLKFTSQLKPYGTSIEGESFVPGQQQKEDAPPRIHAPQKTGRKKS
ncbi:hypothetical protein CEXT_44881 [Caerostris extrusa]|uniref:Uncharacterized protein n=1 Tax=Caerostris extrusa TaxID=172846 RepID=A0AAV4TVC8_CAEEX|nr:hypothetical protein CEXT_44881 [Caerostris extrusa]